MKLLRITSCFCLLLLSLVAFAFLAVHPAAAQELNPPPPPGTTCKSTGNGTICHGTFTHPIFNPSEFTCGSGTNSFGINESGASSQSVNLFYNRAGNATRGAFHVQSLTVTFSNAVTGKSVPESFHLVQTITFGTPGDFSTVTTTITGQLAKVTLPGSGIILLDAGKIVFDANGNIVFEAGKHQYVHAQVAKLCAALA